MITRKAAIGLAAAIALAAAALMISCSGGVSTPDKAIDKMLAAYGGPEKIKNLSSYAGKGFMKKLPDTHIASSYPFDIWRKGALYKTRLMNVQKGLLIGVSMVIYDGKEYYRFEYPDMLTRASAWEQDLMKYTFPEVLSWLPGSDMKCTLEPVPYGGYMIKFQNDDDIVTLTLQKGTYLLEETEVKSASDSTFQYSNKYSDYSSVFGQPFPSRVTGFFAGKKFFEYYLVKADLGIDIADSMFSVMPSDTADIYHKPDTTSVGQD